MGHEAAQRLVHEVVAEERAAHRIPLTGNAAEEADAVGPSLGEDLAEPLAILLDGRVVRGAIGGHRPQLRGGRRRCTRRRDAGSGVQRARTAATAQDETRFVEGLQVAAGRRLRYAERSGDLAHAEFLAAQHAEDAHANGIGQDREVPDPLMQRPILSPHDQRPGGNAVVASIGTPRTLSCSIAIMFWGLSPYA